MCDCVCVCARVRSEVTKSQKHPSDNCREVFLSVEKERWQHATFNSLREFCVTVQQTYLKGSQLAKTCTDAS